MVMECICPNCRQPVNNWWDFSNGIESADDDTYYVDYFINCKCGHKFVYTEWYKLFETTTRDL